MKKTNAQYQKERREKDPEWCKKYHREYMRRKRALSDVKVILEKRSKMKPKTFNKYFTSFGQFFRQYYWLPTVEELTLLLWYRWDSSWAVRFKNELVFNWLILIKWKRILPTKRLMRLFFNID